MRVCEQLPRGVRVEPCEEDEALTAELHHGVFEPRWVSVAVFEQLLDGALVALGFGEMVAEGSRHIGGARQRRDRAQLCERLLLDRMRVGEIRRERFMNVVGHCARPLFWLATCLGQVAGPLRTSAASAPPAAWPSSRVLMNVPPFPKPRRRNRDTAEPPDPVRPAAELRVARGSLLAAGPAGPMGGDSHSRERALLQRGDALVREAERAGHVS